jgi:hypothetical protein
MAWESPINSRLGACFIESLGGAELPQGEVSCSSHWQGTRLTSTSHCDLAAAAVAVWRSA